MNKLPLKKRAQIIQMLVEGNSLRSTSRMADVSINTVTKVLVETGEAAAQYQHMHLRNLRCTRIEIDEMWSFCYSKQKNTEKAAKAPEGAGDCWTWLSICADSKLLVSWMVGDRDAITARRFVKDLASRLAGRIQLTSDGYHPYHNAVENAFGHNVDFGQLVKVYETKGRSKYERYVDCDKRSVIGNPDPGFISTSYIERFNLTMRMSIRRLTRKTNGFSKKVENHAYAIALHTMYYNFGRVHKTLRVTPAMEAGITDHIWSLEEIAGLVKEAPAKPRGAYGRSKITQELISN